MLLSAAFQDAYHLIAMIQPTQKNPKHISRINTCALMDSRIQAHRALKHMLVDDKALKLM